MLSCFAEAMEDLPYFNMTPKPDGGWGPRTDESTISGVVQCTGEGRMLKPSNINAAVTRKQMLWTEDDLETGRFVEWEGDVYRVKQNDTWDREAGFNIYTLEKVIGGDGREALDPAFRTGEGKFS
jgi:hypothetical protein